MSDFDANSLDFQEFERSLQGLMPTAGRLDRDRLMFRLGQQSVLPSQRRWRLFGTAAAVALIAVSGFAGMRLGSQAGQQVSDVDREKHPAGAARSASLPSPAALDVPTPDTANAARARRERPDSLAWSNSWPQAFGPLSIRPGLLAAQTASAISRADTQQPPASDDVPSAGRARVSPLLRFGDREGWRVWLDVNSSKEQPLPSSQKESA